MENAVEKLPRTYWRYRRAIAIWCLIFSAAYVMAVVIAYSISDLEDFPIVSFSAVLFLFLLVPIIIYMTGANREDLEKIKGIIEVLKK